MNNFITVLFIVFVCGFACNSADVATVEVQTTSFTVPPTTVASPDPTQGIPAVVNGSTSTTVVTPPTVTGLSLVLDRNGSYTLVVTGSSSGGSLLGVTQVQIEYGAQTIYGAITKATATSLTVTPYADISTFFGTGYTVVLSSNQPLGTFSIPTISVILPTSLLVGTGGVGSQLAVNKNGVGDVLIGNSAPTVPPASQLLEVTGKTSDVSTHSLLVSDSSHVPLLDIQNNGAITIGNNSKLTSSMTINSSNVTASSSFTVTGTATLSGGISVSGSSPLQFYKLGINVPSTTTLAPMLQVIGGDSSTSTSGLRVQSGAATPLDLFIAYDNGSVLIEGPSPPTSHYTPTPAPALTVAGNLKIDGYNAMLILNGTDGTGTPFATSGALGTGMGTLCNSANATTYDGAIALDLIGQLCVCKASANAWVSVKDGSSNCYVHNATDCTNQGGTVQAAPNPGPSGWPSVSFCKFAQGACPAHSGTSLTATAGSAVGGGWAEYAKYTTTTANSQDHTWSAGDGCPGACTGNCGCSSGSHLFSNIDPSSESCTWSGNSGACSGGASPSTTAIGCY